MTSPKSVSFQDISSPETGSAMVKTLITLTVLWNVLPFIDVAGLYYFSLSLMFSVCFLWFLSLLPYMYASIYSNMVLFYVL